jgi:hypothetical protein
MRLDRFLTEERPAFEPDDAQMYLDLYRNADPEDAFDHFVEERERNVDYLRELPASAGDRRAIHKEYGDHAFTDVARVGSARSGSHPADRGANARAYVPGRRRADGTRISTKTVGSAATAGAEAWPT